jgi:hypothetical protein
MPERAGQNKYGVRTMRRRALTAVARQAGIIRQPGEDFVKSRENVSRMLILPRGPISAPRNG